MCIRDRYKAFLIKYAEIGVKGKNRDLFEEALVRQIKYALKRCEGEFRVRRTRGRIYIDVLSDDYDYEETIDNLKTVCGVSAICPMVQLEDEGFDKLCESAVSYMDEHYPDKNKMCIRDRHQLCGDDHHTPVSAQ